MSCTDCFVLEDSSATNIQQKTQNNPNHLCSLVKGRVFSKSKDKTEIKASAR